MLNKPQENSQNNNIFSPKEKDFFLTKIFKENQIDSSFLYKGNGGDLFDKILKSGKYNGYANEIKLIDYRKGQLQNFLGKNITDIGCGNGEKMLHLLGNNKNNTYIACDYSGSMIELAEKNIVEKFPNIHIGNHQIMRPENQLLTHNLGNNTYIWLGAEIGCHNEQETISFLKNMNNTGILKGNNVIFSYFTKPYNEEEQEEQKNMYMNKESEDFIFNGLKNLGIDTNYCKYNVEYNKSTSTIEIGVEFTEDYNLILSNGEEIQKKKGDKVIIHQSKRFNQEEIDKLLKKSGLKRAWDRSEYGIGLVVAKRKPEHTKKALKVIGLTSALLATALIGGKIQFEYSQNKEKEKLKEKEKTILVEQGASLEEITTLDKSANELLKMTEEIFGGRNIENKILLELFKNQLSQEKNYNLDQAPYTEKIKFLKKFMSMYPFSLTSSEQKPYSWINNKLIDNTTQIKGDIKGNYSSMSNTSYISLETVNEEMEEYYKQLNERAHGSTNIYPTFTVHYSHIYRDSKGVLYVVVSGSASGIKTGDTFYLASPIEKGEYSLINNSCRLSTYKLLSLKDGQHVVQDFLATRSQ